MKPFSLCTQWVIFALAQAKDLATRNSLCAAELELKLEAIMSSITEPVAIPAEQTPVPPPPRSNERLLSLDVFRGLTLAAMIFVNAHVDRLGYPYIMHARWHGWGLADLCFPFFLFIVGVAIPYAFASRLERGVRRAELYRHIVSRTIILFACGLVLNCFPLDSAPWLQFSTLRYLGVLQRIALCYCAVSVIYLRGIKSRGQAIITASLLIFYFIMLKFVPVPGHGVGILEREGNWIQYIDLHLMRGHLQSSTYEDKGLLSTLPAIATTLIGTMVGQHLRSARSALEKTAQFLLVGNVMMFLGLFWSIWFPINQHLWSSSLVLFMCGMATVILAGCYYLADIRRITWWTKPFVILALNSLTVFMGTWLFMSVLDKIKVHLNDGTVMSVWRLSYYRWFASWAGPVPASIPFGFANILLFLAILTLMYKKGIFLKA